MGTGNLSFLQEEPGTLEALNLWYEAQREERDYLGLSVAGHECKRFLWYVFHKHKGTPPEGRILRLFKLGDRIEDQVVSDLRAVGFFINHQQREVVFSQETILGQHVCLKGHIDGIIKGLIEAPETEHLFECKSAAKKKFDELVKKGATKVNKGMYLLSPGSYRKWNEIYFWQTQFYMLDLKLNRAAAFIYCKDDSRMAMERIELERKPTVARLQRIFEAIRMPIEPDRACPRADYYKAKWCPYYEKCFGICRPAKQEIVYPWE